MLKDILAKVDVSKDEKWDCVGLILFNPRTSTFYHITFGDGTSSDTLDTGNDTYMYLDTFIYNEYGDYLDGDGGQMEFNREESGYTGYINDQTLIEDCLDFMDCPERDFDDLVLIRKIIH